MEISKEIMISVIIPVYNAESYIDECLKSVLRQQEASFEVVLVNDGSTDGSAAICRKWAEKYSNLVYLEQENQGQGTARNVAINHASGKWMVFLDADDIMLPGALKYLENIADEGCDIFVYGCIFISKDESSSWVQLPPCTDDRNEIIKETMSVLWDKMIRAEFWRNEKIQLSNVYGEDVCPVYVLETRAKKIRTFQVPLMIHFDRIDNLSSKPEQILRIVETLSHTIDVFCEKGIFEFYKIALFFMLLNHHKHYYRLWRLERQHTEKVIIDQLEKLALRYFPEEYCKFFEAEKEALALIGCIERPFPAELEARDVFYYPCMEQYLLDEYKASDMSCHFIINVENEIRSVSSGIRTLDWALSYWKMQCAELLEVRKNRNLDGSIFLYCPEERRNEFVKCFEETAQCLWGCGRLDILEDFWKYTEDQICENETIHNAQTPDKFNYRNEYLRLDYNVRTLCMWLRLKQRGVKLDAYFAEHNFCTVGIYGMGYLGKLLLDELENSSLKIKFLIDRNQTQETKYSIYAPEDVLPAADVIVVSVLHQFDHIRMHMKCASRVVSLEEVVDWCENYG